MLDGIGDVVVKGFSSVTPDLDDIYNEASNETMSNWLTTQKLMVASSGAASMAIPGAHMAGMAADLAFLMNRMAVASYGVGAIHYEKHGIGNELSDEDFANVLAIWSGEDPFVLDGVVGKVSGKAGVKYLAKTLAKKAGVKIGNKLTGKIAGKVAGKFSSKMSSKLLSGFIPFVGSAVSGTVNYIFIGGITEAAEKYYGQMVRLAKAV